jgi:hypothetical protein
MSQNLTDQNEKLASHECYSTLISNSLYSRTYKRQYVSLFFIKFPDRFYPELTDNVSGPRSAYLEILTHRNPIQLNLRLLFVECRLSSETKSYEYILLSQSVLPYISAAHACTFAEANLSHSVTSKYSFSFSPQGFNVI